MSLTKLSLAVASRLGMEKTITFFYSARLIYCIILASVKVIWNGCNGLIRDDSLQPEVQNLVTLPFMYSTVILLKMKGFPTLASLVRWACRAGIKKCCSALAALVGPVKNIFSSPYTVSIPLSPSPIKLGRQPCWVTGLLVCVSGCVDGLLLFFLYLHIILKLSSEPCKKLLQLCYLHLIMLFLWTKKQDLLEVSFCLK